jgi:peptide/nickel transport system substrate-binding protein
MDRELMRDAILRGHAVVANDQPIDPTNRFYFAGLPQRPYDPDKAKFHLKRSGIGTSTIPIVCSSAAENSVDMALLLQQSALEIGLDLDVQEMPSDGYWSNQWLKRSVCFGTVNPRPSADVLLTLFFRSTAAWNESAWKSATFDQLLDAARAETDEGKRKQMYADMQTMIAEQAGVGIPLFLNLLDGHVARLKGFAPVPLGSLMGFGFREHVWLDA